MSKELRNIQVLETSHKMLKELNEITKVPMLYILEQAVISHYNKVKGE